MEWLGKKMYPKARPHERRSRMQVVYLMVGIVVFAVAGVGAALWLLNQAHYR
jgi:flagellar basal body-associated protein FliL